MKPAVVFIHGGGPGLYEADAKLVDSLREGLGVEYRIQYPKMPNGDNPNYRAWKAQLAKQLAEAEGKVILVGHSLGGSVLLKFLSEERIEIPIVGIFVIAAPYWGAEDWEVDEYVLREDFPSHLPKETPIFLYHSRDDEVVAFTHLALYRDKLPHAVVREFEERGHQFRNDLSEVAADIASLRDR